MHLKGMHGHIQEFQEQYGEIIKIEMVQVITVFIHSTGDHS